MTQLIRLDELLLYDNKDVIRRFQANYPKQASNAGALFKDMLRYLWLCEQHALDCSYQPDAPHLQFIPVMHEEMRSIDNMWHEFILITKQYHHFCHQYFGHFLHHEPNMKEQLNYSEAQYVHSLELFLHYVYDVLGEEVLKQWFLAH